MHIDYLVVCPAVGTLNCLISNLLSRASVTYNGALLTTKVVFEELIIVAIPGDLDHMYVML